MVQEWSPFPFESVGHSPSYPSYTNTSRARESSTGFEMAEVGDIVNESPPSTTDPNVDMWMLIDMINAHRAHQDRPVLRNSFKLSDIASQHNRDQALKSGRMSRYGSDGSLVENRLQQGGVMFEGVCEFVDFGMHSHPADVLEVMTTSIEGRREILKTEWNEVGADAYIDANGGVYVTVIFCRRQYCTVHIDVPCNDQSEASGRDQ